MEKRTVIKVALVVLFGVLCFAGGRYTINTKTQIRYVTLPVIHVEQKAKDLTPVSERVSDSIKLVTVYVSQPGKASEIKQQVVETAIIEPNIDTVTSLWATAIDFNKERTYSGIALNDDTLGVVKWSASVQYNTLTYLSHDITPVRKESNVIKERAVFPFVMASYNTFNEVRIGGGVFKESNGVFINYVKDFKYNEYAIELGFIRKF